MRIATLIIGLLVGFMLVMQSFTIGMFSDTSIVDEATSTAGAVGMLMALMWLLGSALVIAFPLVSTILYGLSALLGLTVPTGDFADLRFHGAVAVALTAMAFLGWRGKKRKDAETTAERQRQIERDARLERLLHERTTVREFPALACPSCGSAVSRGTKFCGECGASVLATA